MAGRKNLCAMIPADLHERVCQEREKLGMTNSDYVLKVLTEYYDMMENGGTNMAKKKGEERTIAFPVSEEFYQRLKRYLERETKRTGRRLTQKDFCTALIEAKLDEADREDAEAARNSQPADENPATGEPEATESENGEAAEDSQPADAEPATEEPEDTENESGEEADENAE